jgi:hypothetical protein
LTFLLPEQQKITCKAAVENKVESIKKFDKKSIDLLFLTYESAINRFQSFLKPVQ